jgi:hypothetical protein
VAQVFGLHTQVLLGPQVRLGGVVQLAQLSGVPQPLSGEPQVPGP